MTATMHLDVWDGILSVRQLLGPDGNVMTHVIEFTQNRGQNNVVLFIRPDQLGTLARAIEAHLSDGDSINANLMRTATEKPI